MQVFFILKIKYNNISSNILFIFSASDKLNEWFLEKIKDNEKFLKTENFGTKFL